MEPWTPDAGEVNPKDIPEDYIYVNPVIHDYLEPKSHDRKLFLIGSKGSGKTLLLRRKAQLYWNKLRLKEEVGYRISASNELVESMDFSLRTLSRKEMENLMPPKVWVRIWKFSLCLLILRRTKIGLPPGYDHVDEDFPTFYRLSNILTKIINDVPTFVNSDYLNCRNDFAAYLSSNLNNSFVLFIDRLDQALNDLLNNSDYKNYISKKGENMPFKVWQSAQFGLLESSYNLTTAVQSHIKVFATARKEALHVKSDLVPNILGYCTRLNYTMDELREIFENNINHTPAKDLHSFTSDKPLERFFGFVEMEHPKAKSPDGIPRSEDVFKFLVRHTFGRPREIIQLGRILYNDYIRRNGFKEKPLRTKKESLRRAVNKAANEYILNGYFKEIVPTFTQEYLDSVLDQFKKNIIRSNELKGKADEALNYLYRLGLLGFVQNREQCFLAASEHLHNETESLPRSSHYLLHPSLDTHLQKRSSFEEFYDPNNIVGNGYPFHLPPIYTYDPRFTNEVDYYLPRRIPGNGTQTECWKKAKIETDIRELFSYFFTRALEANHSIRREEYINDAFRMLKAICNIYFAKLIEKRTGTKKLKLIEEEEKQLTELRINSAFSATISSVDEKSFDVFGRRMFGRIACIGMLLHTEMTYSEICHVLRTFTMPSSRNPMDTETAVRYLRKAFFLYGLPSSHYPHDRESDRILWENLSSFEREYLEEWWINFTNHELLMHQSYSDAEKAIIKDYLKMF